MAHEIGERHADLDLFLVALAVDGERDLARLAHVARSVLWPRARQPRARLTRARGATARSRDAGGRMRARARRRSRRSCGRSRRPRATARRSATWPTSACSTSRARTGATATPPSVTEARVILPALSSSQQRRRRHDGEIAVPARELDEAVAVAGRPERKAHCGQRSRSSSIAGVMKADRKVGEMRSRARRSGPATVTVASCAAATVTSSADGSRWQSEPPMVPRLRVWRWPTCRIASCISGQRRLHQVGEFEVALARHGADLERAVASRGCRTGPRPG